MTFSPKINSVREQRSFKKRGPGKVKEYKLRYGSAGLFFSQTGLIKSSYFLRVKRIIKKRLKRRSKRNYGRVKRIWFFLSMNFPLTMKSTNSRMGKGKGNFLTWAVRVKFGQPMAEFKGFSFFFIKGLKNFFFKKLKLRLEVVYKTKIKSKTNISSLSLFTWHA